jgi:hypothetical protein
MVCCGGLALTSERGIPVSEPSYLTQAERASQARTNLVNALRECGQLADAVEHFDGRELLEVLDYLDSLRFVMAESGQLLAGVTRGIHG